MLNILYQDEWLIAVDKPAGQLVHPAEQPQDDDLVTMKILRNQIQQEVHVIHRLDRPTSGVLLFAINDRAAKKIRQDFEKRKIEKIYHAVVLGHPALSSWTCRIPLQKNADSPLLEAETEFTVLKMICEQSSLIEARPKTGRFHQIRRHLLHANHPIIGDYRYLGIERCDQLGKEFAIGTRMLLQAKALKFEHPFLKKEILIEAPPDPLFPSAH